MNIVIITTEFSQHFIISFRTTEFEQIDGSRHQQDMEYKNRQLN